MDEQTIMQEEHIQTITLSMGTKAVCTGCGREDAPYLFLRRRRGLYELLCKNFDGSGCYVNRTRTMCQYSDPDNIDCNQLAEWGIAAADNTSFRQSCTDHLGLMMRDISIQMVSPLDD